MSEDFLSRWSRRKSEARHEAAEGEPDTVPGPPDSPPANPPEPSLTPDEIAALPKIEEITADSDIKAFLRRGVPAALRNAALRRMWMLDPAIRDFVGHARDYDYDWNTPGGAPGHGTLEPGDDVGTMVRRILGEPDTARPSEAPDRAASPGSAGDAAAAIADRKPAPDDGGEADSAPRDDGAQPAAPLVR